VPRHLSGEEIRAEFLEFFEQRDHRRIEGASLIPVNDPTLLFVNSGMAPIKPYFTGRLRPPYPRLCNVQPCLRTTDIDDVGDRHHLTFFEMLGSWSIGDYFKERAVELAFELLVDRFGLEVDRLYATVFAGAPELDLPPDEEAAELWERTGIPRERIVPLPMADNFWGPAGETGPCGPSTEVFYDFGPSYGPAYRPGGRFDTTRRYIEIWNAGVFMQFDKKRDGSFEPLPFVSVDTGAGLERLTMALNELPTVYETDLLAPILSLVRELLGERDGEPQPTHRLVTDHLRAATFVLAEGVRPSNEGRGYVARRLIRKAMTAVRRGGDDFDLAAVVGEVVDRFGPHYPLLARRRSDVLKLLQEERDDFARALHRGLERLDELSAAGKVTGRDAFRLFATYGLPFEITRDLAAERGVAVDEQGFQEEFRHHQEVSRARDAAGGALLSPTDPLPDFPVPPPDHFVGYDRLALRAPILGIFAGGQPKDAAGGGDEVEVLTERTPFYAEGGGQVGDRGLIATDSGSMRVGTTTRHGSGYHVHRGVVRAGELRVGQQARLEVDAAARAASAANHSATHLVNAALRKVLGEHVRQAGSLVEPERLRFDFTHPAPLTAAQVEAVERLVNEQVFADHPREVRVLPPEQALASGALFLPGEEYASAVRVVSFDDFSLELCGGTHVDATGDIGLFRIVSEQSIAAGVRRINAVTREAALGLTLERERVLGELAAKLRTNVAGLPDRVEQLQQASRGGGKPARPALPELVAAPTPGGILVAAAEVPAGADLGKPSLEAAGRLGAVVCLAAADGQAARVLVAVPRSLAGRVDARQVLAALLAEVDGKGGGSRELAQGGGKRVGGLGRLLERVPEVVDAAAMTVPPSPS
jgi:alanyl-tRNA synthetase